MVVAIGGAIAEATGHLFFYVGDAPESFVPNWWHFGHQLRAGQWWLMEPAGWMGGNYAAEAAYNQWNPVSLIQYIQVSYFDDLSKAAALVITELLVLLAVGCYLLFRSYGASQWPAAAAAVAVPFTGFTLFYEAAGWPAGLTALTWVVFFWWAAHRQIARGGSPIVTWVFGLMAMTSGNPYAALGLIFVLLALAVELLIKKSWSRLVLLILTGALVGATAWLIFGPLLLTQAVTLRQELAMIANDTFMVPDVGDLLASSSPSYQPSVTNWGGALVEHLPSVYLAWFALPLIPWIKWRTVGAKLKAVPSLIVFSALFGLMTLGPSNFWLFRWPIRVIEYFYVGLLAIIAIALTAGLHRTSVRLRTVLTIGIVIFGLYISASVTPERVLRHGLAALIVGVGMWLLIRAERRSLAAMAAVMMIGTLVVLTFQVSRFAKFVPEGNYPPSSVSVIQEAASGYRGTVLQLAQQSYAGPDAVGTGRILFGNLLVPTDHETIVRYSGISFRDFSDALCMDYKGVVCPDVYPRLWTLVPDSSSQFIDAMRVETLVLQRAVFGEVIEQGPPEGWSAVESADIRAVWVRDEPFTLPGRVSGISGTLEVTDGSMTEHQEVVSVTGAGVLTFARLNWPGYTATIDGNPVEVRQSPQGLVQIDVPDGASTVELTFAEPAIRSGWMLVAASGVLVTALSLAQTFGSRRKKTSNEIDGRQEVEVGATLPASTTSQGATPASDVEGQEQK